MDRPRLSPFHEPPAWADAYIGLQYADGGRGPEAYDCWGLLRLVSGERFGIALPAYDGIVWRSYLSRAEQVEADEAVKAFMLAERDVRWSPVWLATGSPPEEPLGGRRIRPGDGVLMRAAPLHVGIVVAPGWMLHIEEGSNSTCAPYDDIRWGRRVIGFYRWEAAGC